jgi:pimeloyl-ACP methyl ester carboxylesterase
MFRVIIYTIITITNFTFSLAQVKTEEFLIRNKEIELPGTLSFAKKNTPLIIWVHGSGNVDRNGNQKPMIKANYIEQFRKAINKNNIAFFSYDKRTANPKNTIAIKENGVLIIDFINDVKKVVNRFKDDKRFTSIILAGHSQGSLIAMVALDNVDKYISIAGAGETIDRVLIKQITKQNPFYGAITEKHLKELKETGKIKQVDPNLMSVFAPQNQPFLSSWITLNPIDEIKKVKIPTLIINGDKDIQLQITDGEKLKKAQPKADFKIIKNMNHILKHIEKDEDNMISYSSANFPISKELIKTITRFIFTSKN